MAIQTIDTATDIGLKTGADKYNANFTDPLNMASRLAQTSPTDTTPERGLIVGAFGVGEDGVARTATDLNSEDVGGSFVRFTSATLNIPTFFTSLFGKVSIVRYDDNQITQLAFSNAGEFAIRSKSSGVWDSAWQPVYTGANYQPETTQGLGVVRIMRNLSGGSVAENASVSGASLQFVKWSGGFAAVPTGITGVGTWKNVSSVSVGSTEYGMFVRIA